MKVTEDQLDFIKRFQKDLVKKDFLPRDEAEGLIDDCLDYLCNEKKLAYILKFYEKNGR